MKRVAELFAEMVGYAGWDVAGPTDTLTGALEWAASADIDIAVLDLRLGQGQSSLPVAEVLRNRGLPFLFVTGGVDGHCPENYQGVTLLRKPFGVDEFVEVVRRVLDESRLTP